MPCALLWSASALTYTHTVVYHSRALWGACGCLCASVVCFCSHLHAHGCIPLSRLMGRVWLSVRFCGLLLLSPTRTRLYTTLAPYGARVAVCALLWSASALTYTHTVVYHSRALWGACGCLCASVVCFCSHLHAHGCIPERKKGGARCPSCGVCMWFTIRRACGGLLAFRQCPPPCTLPP